MITNCKTYDIQYNCYPHIFPITGYINFDYFAWFRKIRKISNFRWAWKYLNEWKYYEWKYFENINIFRISLKICSVRAYNLALIIFYERQTAIKSKCISLKLLDNLRLVWWEISFVDSKKIWFKFRASIGTTYQP